MSTSRKKRKRSAVSRRRLPLARPGKTMVVRGINSFAPPRVRTRLTYAKTGTMTSTTSNIVGQRLFPSNAYDVDPLFLSTAMPGFTEWGGLYRSFRVLGAHIRVDFSSLATLPVSVVLVPINSDLGGGSFTNTLFNTLLAQPNSKSGILSSAGGQDRLTLHSSARTNQFVGAKTNSWDAFVGSTSGSILPSQSWGFAYVCNYQSVSPLSTGVAVTIKLDVDIEFFELTTPSV